MHEFALCGVLIVCRSMCFPGIVCPVEKVLLTILMSPAHFVCMYRIDSISATLPYYQA